MKTCCSDHKTSLKGINKYAIKNLLTLTLAAFRVKTYKPSGGHVNLEEVTKSR